MKIVISQSMYFPWVGLLEQIRLADIYVYYDDVQFTKGGFLNRVQIRTVQGIKWLTIPTENYKLGQTINQVQINTKLDWKNQQLKTLEQAYAKAPFLNEMLNLVEGVFSKNHDTIGQLSRDSVTAVANYFELCDNCKFIDVSELNIDGSSSERVCNIVKSLGGSIYITGHGARNYLDHHLLESHGINIQYMDYKKQPYPQIHGEFTPYVSSLDLIANCGVHGRLYIGSDTVNWHDFLRGRLNCYGSYN
jgi:hypothetical protein